MPSVACWKMEMDAPWSGGPPSWGECHIPRPRPSTLNRSGEKGIDGFTRGRSDCAFCRLYSQPAAAAFGVRDQRPLTAMDDASSRGSTELAARPGDRHHRVAH